MRCIRSTMFIAVTALALGGATAGAQELVVNGGFEAPEVTAGAGWDIFPSGSDGLGWTVEWAGSYSGAPATANLELHEGVNGWLPYGDGGDQYAELDTDWNGPTNPGPNNEQASVKIYQDLPTCPNGEYTLTYAWSPRPGHGNNQLQVFWDGDSTPIATHSGSGSGNTVWTVEQHTLTASGDATRLEFVETGTADSLGMFLDAVSVPEIDCGCESDLIAGDGGDDGTNVGSVATVPNGDGSWTVTYQTDDSWFLTELHLHAACEPDDIPQTGSGNPKVGHFAYHEYPAPGTQTVVFPDVMPDCTNGGTCIAFAAHAVVVNPTVCEDAAVVYGVERGSGDLYAIDLDTLTATLIADIDDPAPSNVNSPNGLAWDPISGRLYFSAYNTEGSGTDAELWFWDGSVQTYAGLADGLVAGATFYLGEYYYVENGTDTLKKVSFNADGTVAAVTDVWVDFAGGDTFRFGDIVIDPAGPTLYGSSLESGATPDTFFSLDLGTGAYTSISTIDGVRLQLAYGGNWMLYGHSTGTGDFVEVNPATGQTISVGAVTGAMDNFTDLASGCMPWSETAWADGNPFSGRSWATWFDCGDCVE